MRKILNINRKWAFSKQATTVPSEMPSNWCFVNLPHSWNAIDGQEVLLPVVCTADLWRETGRYDSMDNIAKFKGRSGTDYVICPTHEEVITDYARSVLTSYRQLPFMLYQIQTKFRDELRVRAGLLRTREFIMKDAYSFHETQEDLDRYYKRCFDAYYRLFKRCGLKNFTDVLASSGDMGGKYTHEFQLIHEMGEDTLYICDCGFRANKEVVDNDNAICPKCGKELVDDAVICTNCGCSVEQPQNINTKSNKRIELQLKQQHLLFL